MNRTTVRSHPLSASKSLPDFLVALTLHGRFAAEQVSNLDQALIDLAAFADQFTSGGGKDWLQRTLAPLRLHLRGFFGTAAMLVNRRPTSIVFPRTDIWFAAHFDQKPDSLPHIVHELAHVIDNRLARRALPATIFGGGPADQLIRDLGGQPRGPRFINGGCRLAEEYHWKCNGGYGNRASAEYFAEALAWSVYDPGCLPSPILLDWIGRNLFKI